VGGVARWGVPLGMSFGIVVGLARPAFTAIPEPDVIFYGTATRGGAPLAAGDTVWATLQSGGAVLTSYQLGSNPAAPSHLYILRLPVVHPQTQGERPAGTTQVGDGVTIGIIHGTTNTPCTIQAITDRGVVLRVDLACPSSGQLCGDGSLDPG